MKINGACLPLFIPTLKSLVFLLFPVIFLTCLPGCGGGGSGDTGEDKDGPMYVFATYFESDQGVEGAAWLAESLRTFGGEFAEAPVWLYVPEGVTIEDAALLEKFAGLGVELRTSPAPEAARWFYYGGKPYAAAAAEAAAETEGKVLVWLDGDSIILSEPKDFALAPGVGFAYLPVMHNRSGMLYDEPPNDFWARIYELQGLTDEMLFPMITPADKQTIRAYIHCGVLSLRPEKGILRRWATEFEKLYTDSALADMCKAEITNRIFLHQAALTGAVLHTIGRDDMVELSEQYNYPIFFQRVYGAEHPYLSLDGVVLMRLVVDLSKIGPNWPDELSGPPEKIAWLREHLI